jgi:hypothetical protein
MSGIPQEFNSGQRARVMALREAVVAIASTRGQGPEYDLMELTQWILDGKEIPVLPPPTPYDGGRDRHIPEGIAAAYPTPEKRQ